MSLASPIGKAWATLTVRAGAVTVTGPQAVLMSNSAYEMSDIAGPGHRVRLDAGTLGVVVVVVAVNSAMGAVGLLGGRGVTVMIPTPVRCAVRPGARRALASLRPTPVGTERPEMPV